jgi:hypothetical protein
MSRKGVETYPWNKWMAKTKFTLVKGVDYFCLTHSMIVQIRGAAAHRNKSASIKTVEEDGVTKLNVELT